MVCLGFFSSCMYHYLCSDIWRSVFFLSFNLLSPLADYLFIILVDAVFYFIFLSFAYFSWATISFPGCITSIFSRVISVSVLVTAFTMTRTLHAADWGLVGSLSLLHLFGRWLLSIFSYFLYCLVLSIQITCITTKLLAIFTQYELL